MLPTQHALDIWMARGFDGICSNLIGRASAGGKLEPCYMEDLLRVIDMIETILCGHRTGDENVDQTLFIGISYVAQMMYDRHVKTNTCSFDKESVTKTEQCLTKLKTALKLFREKK